MELLAVSPQGQAGWARAGRTLMTLPIEDHYKTTALFMT
jgi:hypothetical protein